MKIQLRLLPYILLSILALLFAMWAGLLRMGWLLPDFSTLSIAHGPLMISGFLGVLIPLERAVAIRQKWMFAVPLVAGLGWVSLLFSPFIGALLLTLGSLGSLEQRSTNQLGGEGARLHGQGTTHLPPPG